ncbi:alpha-glucan family phosphorylase [Chloroflexota bacterium]
MLNSVINADLIFAYFSIEFGIDPAMPTYAGGLGILAGDTLRAAADSGISSAGISLLHRKGYFRQILDKRGHQSERESVWEPQDILEKLPPRVVVDICGRHIQIQAWRYIVRGAFGNCVPIYFLDTDIPENSPYDRSLTDHLYGGDQYYRLCQQAILGLGGIATLRTLGHHKIQAYHMNEGHSAFTCLALLEEQFWGRGLTSATPADIESVMKRCVFTTHTPILAGHETFPMEMVRSVLGEERAVFLSETPCFQDNTLSMTKLASAFSRYINGVSMRHEKVSSCMFSNNQINAITNGVHAVTWACPAFQSLYDNNIPEWRRDNRYLRYIIDVPVEEILNAHRAAKREMITEIKSLTGISLNPEVLTIGFARRATAYKRNDLIFSNQDRLKSIVKHAGPIQIICGGKAHPHDEEGKELIRRIFNASGTLWEDIPVIFIENYNIALARYLVSGVDIWLNTPIKPLEASGTSGMKAAMNGVPSFSILDGWWIEGHIEGVTGWSIGAGWASQTDTDTEIMSLHDKLEHIILPMFYRNPSDYAAIMRSAIAINGSYFNTQRMVNQYVQNAYLRSDTNHS